METTQRQFVVLSPDAITPWLGEMLKHTAILGPVKDQDGKVSFEYLSDPNTVCIDYNTTVIPPTKKVFLPKEGLTFLTWSKPNGKTVFTAPPAPPPLVVFGVHPYDIRAFMIWEKTMLDGAFVDPVTAARVTTMTLIGLDVITPPKDSFCTSVDAHTVSDGYDVMLTVLDDKRILAEGRTEKGLSMLALAISRVASDDEITLRETRRNEVALRYPHTLPTTDISVSELLYEHKDDPFFAELGDLCVTCGKCTVVCPTCTCFSPVESSSLDGSHGERKRISASCQVAGFTLVAGGMINRKKPADRIANRLFDKFAYHQGEDPDQCATTCIGCGRCVEICPAHIADPVKSLQQLLGDHHG